MRNEKWGPRRCEAVLNPQSSFYGPHSSILNSQSSVPNPQSSIFNPHSTVQAVISCTSVEAKKIANKIKFWENLLVRTSLVCARTYKLDPGLLNIVFILKTSHVVALFYGENALTILVKCPLTNFCEFSLQNQLWVAMPDTNSIWNWIHITAELFTGFKRKEKVMGSVLVGYTVFL